MQNVMTSLWRILYWLAFRKRSVSFIMSWNFLTSWLVANIPYSVVELKCICPMSSWSWALQLCDIESPDNPLTLTCIDWKQFKQYYCLVPTKIQLCSPKFSSIRLRPNCCGCVSHQETNMSRMCWKMHWGSKNLRVSHADGCEQDTAKYFLLMSPKPILQGLCDSLGLVYLMLLSLLAPFEVSLSHTKVSKSKRSV